MSTKEEPGPFDGLERAAPDEPVFTLRAKDDLAPRLVRLWVWRRRRAIVRDQKLSDAERTAELIQCREAEDVAEAMDDWRNGVTVEPAPEELPEYYSGITKGEEELAHKQRYDMLKAAEKHLREADYHINEAAPMLEGLNPEWAVKSVTLLVAARDVHDIADEIAPRRGVALPTSGKD